MLLLNINSCFLFQLDGQLNFPRPGYTRASNGHRIRSYKKIADVETLEKSFVVIDSNVLWSCYATVYICTVFTVTELIKNLMESIWYNLILLHAKVVNLVGCSECFFILYRSYHF